MRIHMLRSQLGGRLVIIATGFALGILIETSWSRTLAAQVPVCTNTTCILNGEDRGCWFSLGNYCGYNSSGTECNNGSCGIAGY